jgi:hypothetical protein
VAGAGSWDGDNPAPDAEAYYVYDNKVKITTIALFAAASEQILMATNPAVFSSLSPLAVPL